MNYRRKKVLRAFNAAEETSSDHTLHRHHPKKRSLGMLFPSQSEPPEEELFPEAEAELTCQVSPETTDSSPSGARSNESECLSPAEFVS